MTEHEPARDGEHAPDHVQEPLPIAMSGEPDRIIEEIGGGTDAPPFPVALMAFAALPGVGYRTLYGLVTSYGPDLGALLAASPRVAAAHLRRRKAPKALIDAIEDLPADLVPNAHKRLERLGPKVHLLGPEELPEQLLQLPGGPRWLFVEGDPGALVGGPHIAVVGTRDASPAGVEAAGVVVRTLAAYPVTLISGLANGIDAAAHARALEFNVRNVAFLGHGINLVFPAETRQLRERIIENGGAVATEYLPDERYRKQQFVQRNRLQAGLSDLVIAVEGQASSGTAHTVRFAGRYRTPVVGLSWPSVGNLTTLISGTPGGQVIDIFAPSGRRSLDKLVRRLAERHGHYTTALTLVERQLAREAECRVLRRSDLIRLQDQIRRLLDDSL